MAVSQQPRRGAATAETQARILASAQQLIAEQGYAATSIVAIAKDAGIAVGTVYLYYPSKEELFVEVFRTAAGHELQAVQEAAAAQPNARRALQAIVETFAGRALHSGRLAWALLVELGEPILDAERLAFRESYRDTFAGVLREGVNRGEFNIDRKQVDVVAAALVGAVGEALVGPLSPVSRRRADRERLVEQIVAAALRLAGARTRARPSNSAK